MKYEGLSTRTASDLWPCGDREGSLGDIVVHSGDIIRYIAVSLYGGPYTLYDFVDCIRPDGSVSIRVGESDPLYIPVGTAVTVYCPGGDGHT